MNCWLCENQSVCELHDPELVKEMEEFNMTINNLFDVGVDNVHEVDVDGFEYTKAPETAPELMPTEKQFAFMKRLFQERSNNEEAQILRIHLLSEHKVGKLTRKMASEAISDILEMEKNQKPSQATLPVTDVAHGQVWVSKEGQIIRVKENQAGTSLYGLIWNGASWKYIPGCLSSLDHRMTAEEASRWGHEHQWCVFCSKPLSDPRSEFAGYGEKCASNNSLPWGATSA